MSSRGSSGRSAVEGATRKLFPGQKIGPIFRSMKTTCPAEISAYGLCIARNKDQIDLGVCAREFEALQRCFKSCGKAPPVAVSST